MPKRRRAPCVSAPILLCVLAGITLSGKHAERGAEANGHAAAQVINAQAAVGVEREKGHPQRARRQRSLGLAD